MAKAKKKAPKKSAKKAPKKSAKKSVKRRAPKKGASHHLDAAHTKIMRSLASVKKSDVDALKRIERAVEHALENARTSKE